VASKTRSIPDRVPLPPIRELKPIAEDEGISWDTLMKIVGPSVAEAKVTHDKDGLKARQRVILGGWDEAAQIEKAKAKEAKPQETIIKPARRNVKPVRARAVTLEQLPAEPTPSSPDGEYQPTLWGWT
jgi:hypothetical protein